MKKQQYFYHILLTGLMLCLCHGITSAQTPADSKITELATRLSVSPDKARQIQAAYNDHEAEISKLRKDQSISPKEKQKLLKRLLAERLQKLNTVISPAQRMQLYRSDSASMAYVQAQAAAMKQRHQQQIDRMPHKQINSLPSSSVK